MHFELYYKNELYDELIQNIMNVNNIILEKYNTCIDKQKYNTCIDKQKIKELYINNNNNNNNNNNLKYNKNNIYDKYYEDLKKDIFYFIDDKKEDI